MAVPTEKGNVVVAIVYDFETGGLDCTKCAATQISMHAVRLDTFEVMEKYNSYIYPYNQKEGIGKVRRKTLKSKYEDEEGELMDYEEPAMLVTGITLDQLYKYGKPIDVVCQEIIEFIQRNTLPVVAACRPFLVGQNPQFDSGFMQQIMLYSELWPAFTKVVRGHKDFWGNFQPTQLDTIILAQLALDDDRSVTTWKLEAIADRLGVDLDDAHDADADVTATREIMRVLTSRLRNNTEGGGEMLATEKRERIRDYFKI